MTLENETPQLPRHRRGEQEDSRDKYFNLRNWLNIIFMLGAVAGMIVYFFTSHTVGTVIIVIAMLFKVAECCLRFIR